MASQTNGNQFRDDEIIILEQLRDGKMVKSIHPKIGGRLRPAHEQNQQLSIGTEIIRYDESLDGGLTVPDDPRRSSKLLAFTGFAKWH
jgi:hypothetical protein